MNHGHSIVRSGTLALLCCLATCAASAESSFGVSGRYTAQRKPRITVLGFENTNSMAQNERYGSSVEAMLVTFLKRKSQFAVVERQKLGIVLEEWKRNQSGMTNLKQGDPSERELLEKIDGIVLGNVTLLNATAEAKAPVKKGAEPRAAEVIRDQRIEIDAKLLSRTDGRIIAAAQRSGPVSCLRSIVERLGVALEHEFLRPYYGKLRFKFSEPENVRIFLTPILLDTALDEEKPPVELGSTVVIGSERDQVEPWTTDPTIGTIRDILSGFYSLRLERPGYEGIGTENARWEARDDIGRVTVYDRTSGEPVERTDSQQRRFVVSVDPLTTETIDGDGLGFAFRKLGGSIEVRVKRQYLDADFMPSPSMQATLEGDKLEINNPRLLDDYADDKNCALFEELRPPLGHPGVTRVAAGQSFDFDTFKGGGLFFDDYHGETVPVGTYRMLLQERHYQVGDIRVAIRDQDHNKPVRTPLSRQITPLTVTVTGERAGAVLLLEGRVTHKHPDEPLDNVGLTLPLKLAVDEYTARTNVPGLGGWQRSLDLLPKFTPATVIDPDLKSNTDPPSDPNGDSAQISKTEPERRPATALPKDSARPPTLHVKTRLSVGGRVSLLPARLDPKKDDVYVDREVERILDALIGRPWVREIGPKDPSLLGQIGRHYLSVLAPGLVLQPQPPSTPVVPSEAAEPTGNTATARQPATPPATPARGTQAAPATAKSPGHEAPNQEPEEAGIEEPLPKDPEELAKRLAERLQDIDLLVLYDQDLEALLRRAQAGDLRAQAADALRDYIEQGGALFTFVSAEGDYQKVLGAPFALEGKGKNSDRFELSAGDTAGVRLKVAANVKVASKRRLPQIQMDRISKEWRVLAFSHDRKDPRIVERGARDRGGYVLVWGDEPGALQARKSADIDAMRAAWAEVAKRALAWARYLMYRRYDTAGEDLRRAEQALDQPRAAR